MVKPFKIYHPYALSGDVKTRQQQEKAKIDTTVSIRLILMLNFRNTYIIDLIHNSPGRPNLTKDKKMTAGDQSVAISKDYLREIRKFERY